MDGAGFSVARVAVLVDGDNIAGRHLEQVIAAARMAGDPAVCRVYGHADRLAVWEQGGFRPVLGGIAKNAADMALTVDALQLAYEGLAEDFVIVSSDRDFTYLVQHLRLMNHRVTLICGPQAPAGLRAICSDVHELSVVVDDTVAKPSLSLLDAAIRKTVLDHGTDKAMSLSALANHPNLRNVAGRPAGGKWRAYFISNPALYRCDPKDPTSRVHLLRG